MLMKNASCTILPYASYENRPAHLHHPKYSFFLTRTNLLLAVESGKINSLELSGALAVDLPRVTAGDALVINCVTVLREKLSI